MIPADSILQVHGLPTTITLSSGHRVGPDSWNVPLKGLSNLELMAGEDGSGSFNLHFRFWAVTGASWPKRKLCSPSSDRPRRRYLHRPPRQSPPSVGTKSREEFNQRLEVATAPPAAADADSKARESRAEADSHISNQMPAPSGEPGAERSAKPMPEAEQAADLSEGVRRLAALPQPILEAAIVGGKESFSARSGPEPSERDTQAKQKAPSSSD